MLLIVTLAILVGIFAFAIYMLATSNKGLDKVTYPEKFSEYVEKYADENGLDTALVYAVIKTESNFDPDAQSGVGAMGLMQLMPETFEWIQYYTNGEVTMETEQLLDPETNIKYGCACLKYLTGHYTNESTAIAAYNAGFGAVDGWLEDSQYSHDGETLYNIPYPETEYYVEKVEIAKKSYEQK